MKTNKRVLVLLGGLTGGIFLLIACLPMVVSGTWVKNKIVTQINEQMPGRLQIDTWSLNWFKSLHARGITYEHPATGLHVKIAALENQRGLFGVLTAFNRLNRLVITEPVLTIDIDIPRLPRTTAAPSTDQPPSPSPSPPTPSPGKMRESRPDFYGQLQIVNGAVRTRSASQPEKTIAQDIRLTLEAASFDEPISYRLLLKAGDGIGRISGQGAISPARLPALGGHGTLQIQEWEVEDVFTLLARRESDIHGRGRLSADLQIKEKDGGLHTQNRLTFDRLTLWGGPLGTDRPQIDAVAVDLNARRLSAAPVIENLNVQSSLGTVRITGTTTAAAESRKLLLDSELNLAAVFNQFPGTLKLQPGTQITDGKLTLNGTLATSPQQTRLKGDIKIAKLTGNAAGKKLQWDQPVTITVDALKDDQGARLEQVAVRSAFLEADGQGHARELQINLTADLKRAMQEAQKFIQIKDWDTQGNLHADLRMDSRNPQQAEATLDLTIDTFSLAHKRRAVIEPQTVRATFKTGLQPDAPLTARRFQKINGSLQTRMLNSRFTADTLKLPTSPGESAQIDAARLTAAIDLTQLTRLLTTMRKMPPQTRLTGRSELAINASLKDGQAVFDTITADIRDLKYKKDKRTLREKRLALTAKGRADIPGRTIRFEPVTIRTDAGTIEVRELAVADWSDLVNSVATRTAADLDLTKVAQNYGDFLALPPQTTIAGQGRLKLTVESTGPTARRMQVDAKITPFKYARPNHPPIDEPQVILKAVADQTASRKPVNIKDLQLTSRMLSLTGHGSISQHTKPRRLQLDGQWEPDLKRLSVFFKDAQGERLKITGKAKRPYKLRLTAPDNLFEDPLNQATFNGTVYVQSLKTYGLDIGPGDMPVSLAGGKAQIKLDAPANQGRILINPTIDLRRKPYVVSFPEDTDVFADVRLTNAVANHLLSSVHPLFKDVQISSGSLNLFSQSFKLPLGTRNLDNATLAGRLNLNNVRMNASPLISAIMRVAGLKDNTVDFGNLDIAFQTRQGRIESEPVQLTVGGYPLTLSGSIGFDRTLDYLARIPVTRSLVGRDAYRYLEGVTIDVPVGGTADKPKIDNRFVEKATSSLIQQALKKNVEKKAVDLLQQLFK